MSLWRRDARIVMRLWCSERSPYFTGVISAAGLRLVAVQDGELRQRGAGAEEWEEALR